MRDPDCLNQNPCLSVCTVYQITGARLCTFASRWDATGPRPRTSPPVLAPSLTNCCCERQVCAPTIRHDSSGRVWRFEFNQHLNTRNRSKNGVKRATGYGAHALRIGLQKHTRSPRALASRPPPPPSSEHRVRAAADSPT